MSVEEIEGINNDDVKKSDGYYTKRLFLIVIPLIIVIVAFVFLLKNKMHAIEMEGDSYPFESLTVFGLLAGGGLFFAYQIIVSIIITVLRGRKALIIIPVMGLNLFTMVILFFINVFLTITNLIGVIPVAFPVALVNTIRELFGWNSYYDKDGIEHVCAIISLILGIVMIVLFFFGPALFTLFFGQIVM